MLAWLLLDLLVCRACRGGRRGAPHIWDSFHSEWSGISLDLLVGDAWHKVVPLNNILLLLGHRWYDCHAALLLDRLELMNVHRCFASWLDQLLWALSLDRLVSLPAVHVVEIGAQTRRLTLIQDGIPSDSFGALLFLWQDHKWKLRRVKFIMVSDHFVLQLCLAWLFTLQPTYDLIARRLVSVQVLQEWILWWPIDRRIQGALLSVACFLILLNITIAHVDYFDRYGRIIDRDKATSIEIISLRWLRNDHYFASVWDRWEPLVVFLRSFGSVSIVSWRARQYWLAYGVRTIFGVINLHVVSSCVDTRSIPLKASAGWRWGRNLGPFMTLSCERDILKVDVETFSSAGALVQDRC